MSKTKVNQKASPTVTRTILVIVIVLIVGGIGIGFFFGVQQIQQLADETNLLARKAKASEDNVTRMENLKKRYNEAVHIKPIIDKMVASQTQHQYQDNTINVLNNYATKANIKIAQISFTAAKDIVAPTKAKNTLVTVTLENPVDYNNFIRFMRLVEGGLSQMQILRVDVRKEKDNNITVGAMTIAIYVK